MVLGERLALSFIPRLARGVRWPTNEIYKWSLTSNRIGLASNPRNDDILPEYNGDEGDPRENRTLPRDPILSFFETETPVGFQIEVGNPKSVQEIFFRMALFKRHRIPCVRAKTIVQGSEVPVQERVGVSVGRGGELKGEPVNVTNDPSDGSFLLVRRIAIVKGKVEMLDAGLLTRPIAIPHFATHESSLEVKPF